MTQLSLVVPQSLAGERVDRAVALLTGRTRTEVAELVARGDVRIGNAVVTTRSRRVSAGETLEVDVPAAPDGVPRADAGVAFDVVHADAEVVVVDKPAGLVVHPGAGVRSATLVHGLLARFPDLADQEWPDRERPGIVHRLDKQTSGLLVVARTAAAGDALGAQLRARSVDRRYLALAIGAFEHDAGTIDAPVGRGSRDRTRMAVVAAGRDARTHYTVVERFATQPATTLVECKLDTGRTHQIRVHLAAIGHPVVGDSRYRGASLLGLSRPFLHAYRLAFDHPRTGDRVEFSSVLPPDLGAARSAAAAAP